MSAAQHVPIRTCVGCGARAPQQVLLRFSSRADGALAVLASRGQPGRTAYLHAQEACWRRFASRGGPVRSLRRTVDKAHRLTFVDELKSGQSSAIVMR